MKAFYKSLQEAIEDYIREEEQRIAEAKTKQRL
jgi:hypothetical protein